ncbi:hypothetical protein Lal_00021845 [Lupinus albus]|nr:hypothetical protein Lal_00021845 [Lupinus albus]
MSYEAYTLLRLEISLIFRKSNRPMNSVGTVANAFVVFQIFEVVPLLYMVELRKSEEDGLEFNKNLFTELKDIVWKAEPIKEEKGERWLDLEAKLSVTLHHPFERESTSFRKRAFGCKVLQAPYWFGHLPTQWEIKLLGPRPVLQLGVVAEFIYLLKGPF